MRIGFDVRMIDASGIGVTVREYLNHLPEENLKQMVLFGKPGWSNPYPCEFVAAPYPVYGLSQQIFYPPLLRRHSLSLFHMPHYDFPLAYDRRFVATVHDLIHYLYPEHSTKPFSRAYAEFMLERVSRRAARIVVVSENTRRDLETHFPASRGKIQIIYPGLNPQHRAPSVDVSQSVLKKHGLAKGYLLYVGNLRASKNTPRLIAAYSALRASMPDAPPLVLAGKNFLKELSSESLPAGVKMLGAVEGSDLPALYANASIFVFPSLYEGFGLPPLEAMACGAPVLTSWAASLPEVCGKAAVYVDPLSEASIAEGIKELLMSPSKREELIALGFANIKRFSWARFAASTWQVYHDAMA